MSRAATAEAWDYWYEDEEEQEDYVEDEPEPPLYAADSRPDSYYPASVAPNLENQRRYAYQEYQYEDDEEEGGDYYFTVPRYQFAEDSYYRGVPRLAYPLFEEQPQPEVKRLSLQSTWNDFTGWRYRKAATWIITGVVAFFLVSNAFSFLQNAFAEEKYVLGFGTSASGYTAASTAPGSSLVLGAPSITPEKIDAVLRSYNSPAAGVGRYMYEQGVKYGIDPAYALAFFIHESTAGTKGVATVTKSIGNIRHTPGYENYQGFRKYPTWEAGVEDWYKLIKYQYVDQWKLTTVEKIVPVYAPAADRNNPPAYIRQVNEMVAKWRSGN